MSDYPSFGNYFKVTFEEFPLGETKASTGVQLAAGAFSEVTGLEANMTPFPVTEGGRNYGAAQRTGPVMFGTVVLKRGISKTTDLWRWWALVSGGAYAYRMNVTITVMSALEDANAGGEAPHLPIMSWKLASALPVKFKMADLNAKAGEIAVEELHLVHEGLTLEVTGGA